MLKVKGLSFRIIHHRRLQSLRMPAAPGGRTAGLAERLCRAAVPAAGTLGQGTVSYTHLSYDAAQKFNRCRISIHFAFPARRETATAHALSLIHI